jgi:hypothetical protein
LVGNYQHFQLMIYIDDTHFQCVNFILETLKMWTAGSFTMLVPSYMIIWHHILGDHNLFHSYEYLKSHILNSLITFHVKLFSSLTLVTLKNYHLAF